jgi:N utilization substance protein A
VAKDDSVDPIGTCVGQRGSRVNTITKELKGERIDIILWDENVKEFIAESLSPAEVEDIELEEATKTARVTVANDQYSLAIGKMGQNVRLAARLTGWKIDVKQSDAPKTSDEEEGADEVTVTDDNK